ncbi:hypothetical protein, partial [Pseudoduganella danionis]|uniref:hypothetical protein n=1 Tax=Pseudoduganella danionis TaxID=1890295 RepID=UPI0035B01D75
EEARLRPASGIALQRPVVATLSGQEVGDFDPARGGGFCPANGASSDHTHYAVLPKGRHPALLRAMENSYNIKALEYDYDASGGHSVLYDGLVDLKLRIDDVRTVLI